MQLNQIQKDVLIQLYADNDIAHLDNQPALITLIFGGIPEIRSYSDIEKTIPEYKSFASELRTIKLSIEEIVKLQNTEAQVRFCLIQLSNIVNQDDAVRTDIFNKIVDHLLLDNVWTNRPDLVKKYKDISEIIQTWNHFFVSYTARDTPAVNNLYNPELFLQFPPDIVKNEVVGNNLIAKFIVKCLKKYNSLKVFFDRDSIVCGDIIKEEVYEYCEKTFSFIQLIEDISFNKENGVTNWCYNEYEHFKNYNPGNKKSKHFFIIDGLDVKIAAVPPSYTEWAQDIIDCKYEKINKPFDVTSIKKKCQEFTIRIREARIEHINELIKTVV